MNEKKVPFKRMMFVCTHTRPGEAACSNLDRGDSCGTNLVEELREEVKNRGLKGKIRVAKSGCMDLCAQGPNIMVFDESGAYQVFSDVSPADIPQLVDRFLQPLG